MVDKNKYRPVNGQVDRSWPEKGQTLTKGDSVEGTYIGKEENVGVNSSNVYLLRVGGEVVGVWGSTVIDANFEKIAIGSEVAIEYLGDQRPKTGGKPYKNFWIGVAGEPAAQVTDDQDIPF